MRLYIEYTVPDMLLVLIHVTEIIKKILPDRNTCNVPLFYRLHSDIVLLLLFPSFTLFLSSYHPSNQNNMDINWSK